MDVRYRVNYLERENGNTVHVVEPTDFDVGDSFIIGPGEHFHVDDIHVELMFWPEGVEVEIRSDWTFVALDRRFRFVILYSGVVCVFMCVFVFQSCGQQCHDGVGSIRRSGVTAILSN